MLLTSNMAAIPILAEIGAGLAIEDLTVGALSSIEAGIENLSVGLAHRVAPVALAGLVPTAGAVAITDTYNHMSLPSGRTNYTVESGLIDIADPTSRRRYNMSKRVLNTSKVSSRKGKRVKLRHRASAKFRKNKGKSGYGSKGSSVVNSQFPSKQFKPGRSSKARGGRLLALSKALQNVEALQGDTVTHIENIEYSASTTGDTSTTTGLFILTGAGCGDNNGGDLYKILVAAFNLANTGGIATSLASKKKVFIFSVHVNFYMRESGTAQALVDYYECTARRSCDVSEYGSSVNAMQTTSTSRDAIPSALTAVATSTTDSFASPFMWHEFGKYWKIKLVKQFNLNNGTTQNWSRHYTINKFIDPDTLSIHDYIAGMSRMFMFKTRGDLTGTNFNDSTVNVKCEITYRYTAEDVDGSYCFHTVTAPT